MMPQPGSERCHEPSHPPIRPARRIVRRAVRRLSRSPRPRRRDRRQGDRLVSARRPFKAFDGVITGRTLEVLPKRLIVQSWRSAGWHADDPDSILVLAFSPGRRAGTGRIDLTHIGVPGHDHDCVVKGWRSYYWRPWRALFKVKNG